MRAGQAVRRDPVAEVPRQVYGISPIQGAGSVLLVEELGHEVVANQGSEVRIAYRSVLSLRNVDVLLFLRLLLSNHFLILWRFWVLSLLLVLLCRLFSYLLSISWWSLPLEADLAPLFRSPLDSRPNSCDPFVLLFLSLFLLLKFAQHCIMIV